jgi:hypothetical protein
VPELGSGDDEARVIIRESAELGELINKEDKDMVVLTYLGDLESGNRR